MISNLSYRQKNQITAIATIVTFLVVLLVPVRRTYLLYVDTKRMEEEVLLAERAPAELAFYRQETQALQKVIHFNETDVDLKEDILNQAAAACAKYGAVLINLQAPGVHTESDFRIETYEVILKGDYINLLKALVHIENQLVSGKVVATRFLLEKRETTGEILAHIYVQTSKGQIK
jgi:hypothetical protein